MKYQCLPHMQCCIRYPLSTKAQLVSVIGDIRAPHICLLRHDVAFLRGCLHSTQLLNRLSKCSKPPHTTPTKSPLVNLTQAIKHWEETLHCSKPGPSDYLLSLGLLRAAYRLRQRDHLPLLPPPMLSMKWNSSPPLYGTFPHRAQHRQSHTLQI